MQGCLILKQVAHITYTFKRLNGADLNANEIRSTAFSNTKLCQNPFSDFEMQHADSYI
jgi:hypothetical protein